MSSNIQPCKDGLTNKADTPPHKSGFLDQLAEITGFVQIVLFCLAAGIILSLIIYSIEPSRLTLVLGILLSGISLAIGIRSAISAYKGKGTLYLTGRFRNTPQPDNPADTEL